MNDDDAILDQMKKYDGWTKRELLPLLLLTDPHLATLSEHYVMNTYALDEMKVIISSYELESGPIVTQNAPARGGTGDQVPTTPA